MQQELVRLLAARSGHFRLESGHHGDLWLDIPRLYLKPSRLRRFAADLARRLAAHGIEAVCGPLVEGAFLAQWIAEELDAEFYFAEQVVSPPGDGLFPIAYRIPKALRATIRGRRTAVIDDVINAGSAVRGALSALRDCEAKPVALGALMVLGLPASSLAAAEGIPLETLASLANTLWEPSECPLCDAGVPLES